MTLSAIEKPSPELSVFINCPYDKDYARLFDAIFFATVCCELVPRSALESGTTAEPRMDRIVKALFDSCYSIHDLSRSRGEGPQGFARFNMPLELGMAMARRYMTRRWEHQHDWLLLVPADHQYLKFASDLAAFDPTVHDGSVATIIPGVMSWLSSRKIEPDIAHPTPRDVLAAFPAFEERKKQLASDWYGSPRWHDLLKLARECAPKL